MTRTEVIAIARDVGLLPDNSHPTPETRAMRKRCEVVMRFAALVAEAEREACAQVCDAKAHEVRLWCNESNVIACATAIRERNSHVS